MHILPTFLLALSGLSTTTLASPVSSEPRYPPNHILSKPANTKPTSHDYLVSPPIDFSEPRGPQGHILKYTPKPVDINSSSPPPVSSEPHYPPGHILYHVTKPVKTTSSSPPTETLDLYPRGNNLHTTNSLEPVNNENCPTGQDAVREMEKIVFDYSKSVSSSACALPSSP